MPYQDGFGDNGTEATGLSKPGDGDDRMQKKSENVAHAPDGIKLKNLKNSVACGIRLPQVHFTLALLWQFRVNRKALLFDEVRHLSECDECLLLLGLCQSSQSLSEAERELRELGRIQVNSKKNPCS
jgi:hypothetical protein